MMRLTFINMVLALILVTSIARAGIIENCRSWGGTHTNGWYDVNNTVDCYWTEKPAGIDFEVTFMCTTFGCGYYSRGYSEGPYSETDPRYGRFINAPTLYGTKAAKYSTLENFVRIDNALDNNYYRNIEVSRDKL